MSGDVTEGARALIDGVQYMTLATADADGRPWASPVWFAHVGYREFIWLSATDTRHSQNVAARPELAIVVFDSTVEPGTGQAVYMEARAKQLDGDAVKRGVDVFSARSVSHGSRAWSIDDVTQPHGTRLYAAVVDRHWMLDKHDPRPGDHRVAIEL